MPRGAPSLTQEEPGCGCALPPLSSSLAEGGHPRALGVEEVTVANLPNKNQFIPPGTLSRWKCRGTKPAAGLHPGGSVGGGKGSSWTTVPEVYPGGRSPVTHVPPKAGVPLSPVDGGLGRWTRSQVPSIFTVAPGSSVRRALRLCQFRAISLLRWWPVLGAPAPAPDLLVQKPWLETHESGREGSCSLRHRRGRGAGSG